MTGGSVGGSGRRPHGGRVATMADRRETRPCYARVLRLRHLRPGGGLCFLYFEGTLAVGLLGMLAELVPWWGALVLPGAVAVMVKVNDSLAGLLARPRRARARPPRLGTRRPAAPAQRRRVADDAPPNGREDTPADGRAVPTWEATRDAGRRRPADGTAVPPWRAGPLRAPHGYRPNEGAVPPWLAEEGLARRGRRVDESAVPSWRAVPDAGGPGPADVDALPPGPADGGGAGYRPNAGAFPSWAAEPYASPELAEAASGPHGQGHSDDAGTGHPRGEDTAVHRHWVPGEAIAPPDRRGQVPSPEHDFEEVPVPDQHAHQGLTRDHHADGIPASDRYVGQVWTPDHPVDQDSAPDHESTWAPGLTEQGALWPDPAHDPAVADAPPWPERLNPLRAELDDPPGIRNETTSHWNETASHWPEPEPLRRTWQAASQRYT